MLSTGSPEHCGLRSQHHREGTVTADHRGIAASPRSC